MDDFVLDENSYAEVTQRGEAERRFSQLPTEVKFDRSSGRIIVEFANGSAFMVPARLLQGLQHASDDEINEVELLGETGLHWEKLDVDFTIAGLMHGIFGTAKLMQAARRGGQSRSAAKIAASRKNGARGGRPKKIG